MNEYWEVLDPLGNKLANTGSIDDAIRLCEIRGQGYTYRQVKFIMDQVIDITSTSQKQLPTTGIVDLGGEWDDPIPEGVDPYNLRGRQPMQPVKKQLKKSDAQVFVP
jgi:hypothetical protein